MYGGSGNDTYVVDNANDIINEMEGQGTDRVFSQINSYTLPDYVEELLLLTGMRVVKSYVRQDYEKEKFATAARDVQMDVSYTHLDVYKRQCSH